MCHGLKVPYQYLFYLLSAIEHLTLFNNVADFDTIVSMKEKTVNLYPDVNDNEKCCQTADILSLFVRM